MMERKDLSKYKQIILDFIKKDKNITKVEIGKRLNKTATQINYLFKKFDIELPDTISDEHKELIKKEYQSTDIFMKDLGKKYGYSEGIVRGFLNREGIEKQRNQFTEKEIKEVINLLENTLISKKKIGKMYGKTEQQVDYVRVKYKVIRKKFEKLEYIPFTEKQKEEMRFKYNNSFVKPNDLAKEYNTELSIIKRIIKKKNRKEFYSKICQEYNNGINICRLSKEYNTSDTTIWDILRRYGVKRRDNKIFSDEQEVHICELFKIKGVHEIACEMNSKIETVRKILIRKGVYRLYQKQSIGEDTIEKFLKRNNINYEREYSFPDCVHIRRLKFDFYLPNHNICIEYQGAQHYIPWNSWKKELALEGFKTAMYRDFIKHSYCINKNMKLVIIPYWKNKEIETILKNEI